MTTPQTPVPGTASDHVADQGRAVAEGAVALLAATDPTEAVPGKDTSEAEAFVGRLFEGTIAAMDLFTVYLGTRLGLYAALAEHGPATSAELAGRTGTHERYVREWLEHQAAADIVGVATPAADPLARRYRLPPGRAEVLLDEESLLYFAPIARFLVAFARAGDQLLDAFRTGEGVPYVAFGADAREAQAAINRPAFTHLLGSDWLPALPDVHDRLRASPPARVADIGCGAGWSSIGIARAYPDVRVDGFDLDEESIRLARGNAAAAGVADRVTFHHGDAAGDSLAGQDGTYDLVTAFEMVHDVARPVELLAMMRRLAGPRGSVLVVDERVGEAFEAPASPVERLMYGYSVLMCLPTGIADGTPERPSAATGTVMRPETLRRYAREAGFSRVEVLPVEHDFFSFYRLFS